MQEQINAISGTIDHCTYLIALIESDSLAHATPDDHQLIIRALADLQMREQGLLSGLIKIRDFMTARKEGK